MSESIQALIFDLDDTLLIEVASADAAFAETCQLAEERFGVDAEAMRETVRKTSQSHWQRAPDREYCVRIGISSWEGLWARFDGPGDNLRTMRDWAPTYRRAAWSDALNAHDIDDFSFADELAEAFFRSRRTLHLLFDDTLPTLASLRGRYRMGLLTNGASDLQREKIDGARIGTYFDATAISGDVGVKKPQPQMFEAILAKLGVQAPEAVMVGNSLVADVAGAQNVGIRTVWLNRTGKENRTETVPDAEILGLEELPELLPTIRGPKVKGGRSSGV